jgi:hypothetical protein
MTTSVPLDCHAFPLDELRLAAVKVIKQALGVPLELAFAAVHLGMKGCDSIVALPRLRIKKTHEELAELVSDAVSGGLS